MSFVVPIDFMFSYIEIQIKNLKNKTQMSTSISVKSKFNSSRKQWRTELL